MGLRELRHEKGLSQRELSRIAGVSACTIQRAEDGNYDGMWLSNFKALSDYFGLSMDQMYKNISDIKQEKESFLKEERKKRNLTQKEFREELDICIATLIGLEKNGIEGARAKTIKKIAKYLNLTIKELLEKERNHEREMI